MDVHISEDFSGRLVLEADSGTALTESPDIGDVLLAFTVVSEGSHKIILDVGGQVADAAVYLGEQLEAVGLTPTISQDLVRIMEKAGAERQLFEEIREAASAGHSGEEDQSGLTIPGLVSGELLAHQVRGLNMSMRVQNLAEFSVQGSGKTAIVLSAFAILKHSGTIDKLVVIGPLSCFKPWEDEIERCFSRGIHSMRWSGSLSQRQSLIPRFGLVDVVLCSYDTARRDVAMLRQLIRESKTLLVLDESHYIKSIAPGARASAVLQLASHAERRMIMTGTPAPHSLYDLWTQFTFLWPHASRALLGSPSQFQEFVDGSRQPARDLRQRLAPFYHRTTQDELNLPEPRSHFPLLAGERVPPEQTRIVRLLETRILADARRELSRIPDRVVLAQWRRARLIRLLQAASNPGLLLSRPDWPTETVGDVETSDLMADVMRFSTGEILSAKLEWTVTKVRELVQQGQKVVVWTWWVDNLYLLKEVLSDLHPLLLYGAIKPYEGEDDVESDDESRERNIREFRTRLDRPLLIANPAACAEAISLHRECHHAIYVDRTFNCGQFLQSLNRIHRVGLPEGVTTHYHVPILDCAVERSVDTRLRQRQETMYEFLGDDSRVIGADAEEETDVTDSFDELQQDFDGTITEIENESPERGAA